MKFHLVSGNKEQSSFWIAATESVESVLEDRKTGTALWIIHCIFSNTVPPRLYPTGLT